MHIPPTTTIINSQTNAVSASAIKLTTAEIARKIADDIITIKTLTPMGVISRLSAQVLQQANKTQVESPDFFSTKDWVFTPIFLGQQHWELLRPQLNPSLEFGIEENGEERNKGWGVILTCSGQAVGFGTGKDDEERRLNACLMVKAKILRAIRNWESRRQQPTPLPTRNAPDLDEKKAEVKTSSTGPQKPLPLDLTEAMKKRVKLRKKKQKPPFKI